MSFDPVAALLKADDDRVKALEALGAACAELKEIIDGYHEAYKNARKHGWAASDLTRVGFPDPKKYTRIRDPKTKPAQSNPHSVPAHNEQE